jgi:hypothetical protein
VPQKIHVRGRPLVALSVAIAIVAIAPGAAFAAAPVPAAHAAKKKKKKKKKPAPLTATVNGTFTIKQNVPGGFGNDNGPNWQQLTVELKDVVLPFTGAYGLIADTKATATFTYHAEASTADRSWHAGCDSESRESKGTWTGKTTVSLRETNWLVADGKSKRFAGWKVTVKPPDDFPVTSTGSYSDWDSILMEKCVITDTSTPLGGWNPSFAQPDGLGKLADDNRSVPLLAIDTEVDQTGTASGRLKFNRAPR